MNTVHFAVCNLNNRIFEVFLTEADADLARKAICESTAKQMAGTLSIDKDGNEIVLDFETALEECLDFHSVEKVTGSPGDWDLA